jgi:hypothetical protein
MNTNLIYLKDTSIIFEVFLNCALEFGKFRPKTVGAINPGFVVIDNKNGIIKHSVLSFCSRNSDSEESVMRGSRYDPFPLVSL